MINQEKAFKKLSRLKVGALFMEMGTGKTKVALDLIASKCKKVDYILWICPCSLKAEIESERLKWHDGLTLDIVGVESIGSSDRIYLETYERVKTHKTFIVVDESLKIKNRHAKRTERILKLGSMATYKLVLNGTPLSKNVLDLWTQMEFLSPKILNMNYSTFKRNYTEYYLRGELAGHVKRQCNIPHLISKIEPYIFNSELDIKPRKHYFDYYYSMNETELMNYEETKESILYECFDNDNIDFYRLTTTLQTLYTTSEHKQKLLLNLLNNINNKIIIFVKYLANISPTELKIIGNMPTLERTETIQKFKNENYKTLYITYGCGAFGLNLQFCNNIIFADHSFDYAQKIQAEARIYRMGQMQDVNYYNLWCTCGLEKLIQHSLDKKTNLLTEVKNEISKKGLREWLKTM